MASSKNPVENIPLFEGLKPGEIEEIIQSARIMSRAQGSYYFFQGDPADTFYILQTGRIRLTQVTQDGQQILMRVLSPLQLFGAVALVDQEKYPVSAECASECTAFAWPKEVLTGFIVRFPQLAVNVMRMMSRYIQEFQDRLTEMATQRVERRLAKTLLRLAHQTGKKVDDGVVIDIPLTRQELAEMTGTTIYTVSRTMSHWESQGLIYSGRERVVIRHPHGLVLIAEDIT